MTGKSSNRRTQWLAIALAALFGAQALSACKGGQGESSRDAVGVAATDAHQPSETQADQGDRTPETQLAALDGRRPVPLLPVMAWHQKQNMMDHLVVVQQIVAAAAEEDWERVAQAAKGIEASESERQRCEHMGAGAEGFTALALDFHERATAIGKAAEAKDASRVLAATADTLQACTSCHATYRQDVVDESSWRERTGEQDAPSHGGH